VEWPGEKRQHKKNAHQKGAVVNPSPLGGRRKIGGGGPPPKDVRGMEEKKKREPKLGEK